MVYFLHLVVLMLQKPYILIMGICGCKGVKCLSQPETWNLSFPAIIDERGRITIKKEILDTAKLQDGDTVFLLLTGVARKGA